MIQIKLSIFAIENIFLVIESTEPFFNEIETNNVCKIIQTVKTRNSTQVLLEDLF